MNHQHRYLCSIIHTWTQVIKSMLLATFKLNPPILGLLNYLSCSSSTSVLSQLKDDSSDDFRSLPEMPLQPSISAEAELLCDLSRENASHEKSNVHDIPKEETPSEGVVMKHPGLRDQQANKLRRSRSVAVHTMFEKRDRASILEDAVEYIKALKLQVETMMQARGGECTVPYMSCGGKSIIHSPRLSTFMPIRPSFNIGMGIGMPFSFRAGTLGGVGCSAQCAPIFRLSSPGLAFSPFGAAGFPFPTFPAENCYEACKPLPVTASKDGFKQVSNSSGTQTTSCSSGIEVETGGLPLNKDARTSK